MPTTGANVASTWRHADEQSRVGYLQRTTAIAFLFRLAARLFAAVLVVPPVSSVSWLVLVFVTHQTS